VVTGQPWHGVCRFADLLHETPLHADVDGVAICLVRSNGQVYAVHDECTHEKVPLSEGEVSNGTIECWVHGSRFDLATGGVLNLPATQPVEVYAVSVTEDGEVRVCLAAHP
jgi:3-phenylpropionate/trans-cinnamate dioxygenase ferredoxin component